MAHKLSKLYSKHRSNATPGKKTHRYRIKRNPFRVVVRPRPRLKNRPLFLRRYQTYARRLVMYAVRDEELPHPTEYECVDCGEPATCYDHRDYSQPLLVDPVCQSCDRLRGPGQPELRTTQLTGIMLDAHYGGPERRAKVERHIHDIERARQFQADWEEAIALETAVFAAL